MAKKIRERIIPNSGNVFADMGLPDAAELDTKARLGAAICRIVERLMRFLTALGHDVEIVTRPRPRARSARLAVRAA